MTLPPDPAVRFFDLDRIPVDASMLSDDELARVARKATPALKQRQGASFQCIREVLGVALGLPPRRVPIAIAEGGKPFLAGGVLHFNASHSGGIGMVAWGERELGCDVEALIQRPVDRLARKILADAEFDAWQRIGATGRQAWLTRAWVRKEALLKAVGRGLRIAPGSIDVGGGGDRHDQPVVLRGRRWRLRDAMAGVPDGFLAAVCIEDTGSDD